MREGHAYEEPHDGTEPGWSIELVRGTHKLERRGRVLAPERLPAAIPRWGIGIGPHPTTDPERLRRYAAALIAAADDLERARSTFESDRDRDLFG